MTHFIIFPNILEKKNKFLRNFPLKFSRLLYGVSPPKLIVIKIIRLEHCNTSGQSHEATLLRTLLRQVVRVSCMPVVDESSGEVERPDMKFFSTLFFYLSTLFSTFSTSLPLLSKPSAYFKFLYGSFWDQSAYINVCQFASRPCTSHSIGAT